MSREERRIYQIGVLVAAVLIIEMVAVKTEGCNRIDAYAAPTVQFEEITEESSEAAENGLFDANSAMPCVDAESFRRWMETYEQKAGEEARSDDGGADHEGNGTEPDAAGLPETRAAAVETAGPPLYKIAGQEIDASLQIKLYQHLQAAGIPWWYEGALCQMFQESHCQQYAVNQHNGLDMGLFQYRSTYWDWSSDIFDVDAQMSRYASEMSTRFNMGLSMDECISRHNTSDHVAAVNWEYVAQCKQWLSQMEKIK